MSKKLTAVLLFASTLSACAQTGDTVPVNLEEVTPVSVIDTPSPSTEALLGPNAERIKRGRYIVEMIACGACHTDGAIVGEPNPARLLAGSRVGLAYTSPLRDKYPGVVYAPNLTPDRKTGLGDWTDDQVAAAIRTGASRHGAERLNVMSWPLYQRMSEEDVNSIVAYLRSIPAVEHQVPHSVTPGTKAPASYVHFSVYRSK